MNTPKIPKAIATILVLLAFNSGEVAAKEVTAMTINKSPSQWWNKKVTLQGEVDKLYSRGAFVLEDEEKRTDHDHHKSQILVIPRKTNASGETVAGLEQPDTGDEVLVTGTVNQLTKENIHKYYGRNVPPDLNVAIKGSMPVIIAQTISNTG